MITVKLQRLASLLAIATLAIAALVRPLPASADTMLGVRFVLLHGAQKSIPQNASILITRLTSLGGGECRLNVAGPGGTSISYPPGTDLRGLVLISQETISNTGTTDCSFSGIIFSGSMPATLQTFLEQ
jgi:hypothetical protein